MSLINKLTTLVITTITLATVSLHAGVFNYSYTFSNGTVVSGMLEGAQNGNLVTNVTVDSIFFNGTLVPGAYHQTGSHPIGSYLTDQIGEAVVSFDVSLNDFWFLSDFWFNGNPNGEAGNYGAYFAILNNTNAHVAGALWQITPTSMILPPQDRPPLAASWSLTAVTPVPDGGTTGVMLGMTVAGLTYFWRKRR